MTALAQDRNTHRRDGTLMPALVAESTTIYGGALTAVNAAGYLVAGADTAALIFHGVADGRADNSGGSNGDVTALVRRRGQYRFASASALTQANVGDNVFIEDDQTVALVADVTNAIFCGVIAEVAGANDCWVDIEPAIKQADVATHIADTSAAHAAAAISIADTGGFTEQTTVEAALAEIYPKAPVLIADPGDGEAIPVTRSGNVAMTTTDAGGETRTLAVPAAAGIELTLSLSVDGGDCVVTAASAINQTGNNTITFGDAGDTVVLKAVRLGAAYVWRLVVNDGTALSTVG